MQYILEKPDTFDGQFCLEAIFLVVVYLMSNLLYVSWDRIERQKVRRH